MSELTARPAFAGMTDIGSGGGIHANLRQYAIVSVLARKGQKQALLDKTGVVDAARRASGARVASLGDRPGALAVPRPEAMDQLAPLSAVASLSDHSDGYAVFELSGPKVREILAKGVPIDLHPAVFTDTVAVTVVAHIGAIVWQSAPDHFSIAIFRSYAGSFWHWLFCRRRGGVRSYCGIARHEPSRRLSCPFSVPSPRHRGGGDALSV